jgi:2-methylisocitrate lyase-like PEP mutase family enzyme
VPASAAAVEAARPHGVVVTGRAENLIRGVRDLGDTITRLQAYQQAGADVLYAPGLSTIEDVRAVVSSVDRPVNVLLLPGGPSVPELAAAGIARVSVGATLAWVSWGAVAQAAQELLSSGTPGDAALAKAGGKAARVALG